MTTPEALWQTLVALALVGTERRAAKLPSEGGTLAAFVAALDPADAEGRLLGAAAAVALQRRAGYLPEAGAALPVAPCPPDNDAPCPPRAVQHLGALLSGVYREALPEWLGALGASGRVAPPAHLDALLTLGRSQAELRPLILPVLGSRGRWLAGLNPEWDYAIAPAGDGGPQHETLVAQWETGSRLARHTLLQRLRASDPAAARTLVAASWQAERADERAAFLKLFGEGLSMADEPFLEAALDDRGATVRAGAADLLARLPASRLAERMAARAIPLLRWTAGEAPRLLGLRPGRPARFTIELPAALDKAAQRDGVELKGGPRGMGERAWWFAQIIGRTPPAAWSAALGAPAAALVRAVIDDEWRGHVLSAWAEAARRYGDLEWAEALLGLAMAGEAPELDVAALATLLPAEGREQAILALLRDHPEPLNGNHPVLALLQAARRPWSHQLGMGVLTSLRRRFKIIASSQAYNDWKLRAAIQEFACALPPELAPETTNLGEGKRRELPYWGDTLEHFEGMVTFRREMLAALK